MAYINRELALELLKRNSITEHITFSDGMSIYDTIANIPTAEVVKVVRCKDCKYKTVTSDGEYNPEDIVCEYFMSDGFRETDFCSYGEREV